LKKLFWSYVHLVGVALIVVLLDQLTKTLVRTNIPFGTVYRPDWWISLFVRLIHVKNSAAALGFLPGMGNLILVINLLIGLGILVYYPRTPGDARLLRLGMGLLLGGAIGNPIDRLLFDGYVTDFISILNFPVFNLADLSVCIGAVLIYLGASKQEQQKKSPDSDG